jgi:iron(III) transport system substrate-binding protein
MRFLLGAEAQRIFAETNYEYPLIPGVAESRAEVKRGSFIESAVDLAELGQMNDDTLDFLDEVALE